TTTGGGTGGGCSATASVVSAWQGGYQVNVTVTDSGSAAISGWKTSWTLPSGQTVSQSWNATLTSSGSQITAANVSYNGQLSPGGSTSFGFIGSGSGSAPSSLAVTCQAA
uniref:cellulose binding domain-containing protein n=1 Tax=Streptomyces sp. HPF1205 TaxID=2873262 RepID=UPI001CEC35CE